MAMAPRVLHCFNPSNRSSSLIIRDPLYARKNLKELIPFFFTMISISLETTSSHFVIAIWKP
uniref:Dihydropyrimidinase n=1 Tax=Rhizophora mucronata TaxID=61149 RepID=A0A2P2JXR2_RHIMU